MRNSLVSASTRNLSQGPSQLHARGTAAHDHEIKLHLFFLAVGLALRQLKCQQHAPPDLQRVLNRLQARSERLPLSVSKISVARTRGYDQVVVRNLRIGELHHPARQIEILHLRHQHFDVPPAAHNPANRRSNFPRRQSGGRHLVKQRLKSMKILPIDQRNLHRVPRQSSRSQQAAKTGPHNHHPRIGFLHPCPPYKIATSVLGSQKH